MPVTISRPAKTSMQSGRGNTHAWLLEHDQTAAKRPDALMGWQGGTATDTQIRLRFPTCDAAIAYAEKHALAYTVLPDQQRDLKLQSYADNFR
jgi:ETC complex I subunit conserved region